jgi:DNA-binding NarL/FixJ family response regulator
MNRDPLGLSPREQQIIARIAQGKNCRVIGEELGISQKTVSLRLNQLRRKLGVRSNVELCRHVDVYELGGMDVAGGL